MQDPIEHEHKKRIDDVVDYILQHLREEILLEDLANVAHYSPFYLQKVFKKYKGTSPKQFAIRMRIETALHVLVIDADKSIQEVAMDFGFSSPAVFSRAVRNLFGFSPAYFRAMSMRERATHMRHGELKPAQVLELVKPEIPADEILVTVRKMTALSGVYVLTEYQEKSKICEAFKALICQAQANEVALDLSSIFGVINPHQGNLYKAFIALKEGQKIRGKLKTMHLNAGTYACFKVKGTQADTFREAQRFFNNWLLPSGYRISDVNGYEKFEVNPANGEYHEIEREIYVRIEAK